MSGCEIPKTKQLIQNGVNSREPLKGLIEVLESTIELLSLPENDFCWSSWKDSQEAITEVEGLIKTLKSGVFPERLDVAVIFAPTGPLGEVAMSSGWSNVYLKLSENFDQIEHLIYD